MGDNTMIELNFEAAPCQIYQWIICIQDHPPNTSPSPRIKVVFVWHSAFHFSATYSEPIGSAPPKVVSKDKFEVVFVVNDGSANLACPAQGFPVPAFRYFVLVKEMFSPKSPLAVWHQSSH